MRENEAIVGSEAGHGEEPGIHRSKQMGPALLPTPLSPARGRFGPADIRANLPVSSSSARLAPGVSPASGGSLYTLPLRAADFESRLASRVPHRRSRRHPTLLRDRLACSAPKRFARRRAPWQGRDLDTLAAGGSDVAWIVPEGIHPTTIADQYRGLNADLTSHLPQSSHQAFRFDPSAWLLSVRARTEVTVSLVQ